VNREIGLTKLDARNYGALCNGLHDDTYAIQCALNALPSGGGTVVLAQGQFPVNGLKPLRMPDHTAIEWVEGATMRILESDDEREAPLELRGCSDNMLINPQIVGNRYDGVGTTGEWGHAIAVRGAKRLTIVGGRITDCWGDAISLGSNEKDDNTHSEDVIISGLLAENNRRQGLTIARARNVQVLDSIFRGTAGTNPEAGIDVEPDSPGESRGILIARCIATGNKGCGILVWRRNEANLGIADVTIDDCDVTNNYEAGIWTYGVNGVRITNNRLRENRLHGLLLDTGTNDATVMGNRFGYNYSKNAVPARAEVSASGKPSKQQDVLVRGATLVSFGTNIYEAQAYRPAPSSITA
jgi:parallel beta-helix repeat protein